MHLFHKCSKMWPYLDFGTNFWTQWYVKRKKTVIDGKCASKNIFSFTSKNAMIFFLLISEYASTNENRMTYPSLHTQVFRSVDWVLSWIRIIHFSVARAKNPSFKITTTWSRKKSQEKHFLKSMFRITYATHSQLTYFNYILVFFVIRPDFVDNKE